MSSLEAQALSNADVANSLRWKKFPVLDAGYVCLVDAMGADESIVQAARVSYGAGTKKVSDDRTLIRYLMRKRHSTPFEMAELKFLVYVPMAAWRQWIRHRTASVNEYSTRYSTAIDEAAVTAEDAWRSQSAANKQGSCGVVEAWPDGWTQDEHGTVRDGDGYSMSSTTDISTPGKLLSYEERDLQQQSRSVYERRLSLGVAREQARKDLPLSTYTKAYWKIDLHNLFHFLGLRMDIHAQLEIRQYAEAVGNIVSQLFPLAWEAFEDYRLGSAWLSRLEVEMIQQLATSATAPASQAEFSTASTAFWPEGRCREREECLAKLQKLKLVK